MLRRQCAWTDRRCVSLCHLALLAISHVRAGFRRLYRYRALPGDLRRASEEHRAAPVRADCHDERRGYCQPRRTKVKGLAFQARETLMICRQPREAECREIRTQLAVLTGRALRRAQLRHHVERCEDCRAFAIEVRRQKAGLAILLSVVPSLTLKHSVLIGLSAAAGKEVAAASATPATADGPVAVTGGDGAMADGEAAAGAQSVGARLLLAGAPWRALRRRGAGTRRPVPPSGLAHGDPATQRSPNGGVHGDDVRDPTARRDPPR